MTDYYFAMIVF